GSGIVLPVAETSFLPVENIHQRKLHAALSAQDRFIRLFNPALADVVTFFVVRIFLGDVGVYLTDITKKVSGHWVRVFAQRPRLAIEAGILVKFFLERRIGLHRKLLQ